PTSLRPTTTQPETDPTTTPPAEVEIPALVGQSSADAREALDRVGLAYRLTFRRSETAPAGTVIDSDPPEGRAVPPDTEVTLVIASAPSPSPSATSPTPGEGGEQEPDEQEPDEN
ncbi:MAG TPA: PASTA domain-containing protein, partial [Actinoplanes sp.]